MFGCEGLVVFGLVCYMGKWSGVQHQFGFSQNCLGKIECQFLRAKNDQESPFSCLYLSFPNTTEVWRKRWLQVPSHFHGLRNILTDVFNAVLERLLQLTSSTNEIATIVRSILEVAVVLVWQRIVRRR